MSVYEEALIGADYLEKECQSTCEAVRQVVRSCRTLSPHSQFNWHWIERLFHRTSEYGQYVVPTVQQWSEHVLHGGNDVFIWPELFFADGVSFGKFTTVEGSGVVVPVRGENGVWDEHYRRVQIGFGSGEFSRRERDFRRYEILSNTHRTETVQMEHINAIGYKLMGALAATGVYRE